MKTGPIKFTGRASLLGKFPNALAVLILIFEAADRNARSVSDTLYGVFPFFASEMSQRHRGWKARRASRRGLMSFFMNISYLKSV
jgi:hypothetical protein